MKKFDVCFSSATKGKQFDRSQIDANSPEEAFHKFLDGKPPNDYEVVVVSAASFLESIRTMPESFPNPLYRPSEIPKPAVDKINTANINLNCDDLRSTSNMFFKFPEEKLDKLIELHEKQLYWIRIIGIPFLFAAIGTFLALIIRIFN